MQLKKLEGDFTVCQVADYSLVDLDAAYCFALKTDEEKALVCRTKDVPPNVLRRADGWKGLRIQGPLDFSLVGILSALLAALAENAIPVFAVSTYDTDYLLIKREHYPKALDVLQRCGHTFMA